MDDSMLSRNRSWISVDCWTVPEWCNCSLLTRPLQSLCMCLHIYTYNNVHIYKYNTPYLLSKPTWHKIPHLLNQRTLVWLGSSVLRSCCSFHADARIPTDACCPQYRSISLQYHYGWWGGEDKSLYTTTIKPAKFKNPGLIFIRESKTLTQIPPPNLKTNYKNKGRVYG